MRACHGCLVFGRQSMAAMRPLYWPPLNSFTKWAARTLSGDARANEKKLANIKMFEQVLNFGSYRYRYASFKMTTLAPLTSVRLPRRWTRCCAAWKLPPFSFADVRSHSEWREKREKNENKCFMLTSAMIDFHCCGECHGISTKERTKNSEMKCGGVISSYFFFVFFWLNGKYEFTACIRTF